LGPIKARQPESFERHDAVIPNDPPDSLTIPVSVLVLTRDEEQNIRECLSNLRFSQDVVVLDSCSTDRTVEVARSFPHVRIFEREFDTEYRQRNYGLHEIEYKHEWVYICDADERLAPDLISEIREVTSSAPDDVAAYRLRYKNMYLGRWIRHASGYPVWITRLVRPKRVSYEIRETNVHPVVQGKTLNLEGHFVHYSFNGGLTRWFHKHNFYSSREAKEGVKVRRAGLPSLAMLRNPDPSIRRRSLKNLSFFLCGRAWWRFLHTYLIRGGILDGTAGFRYCCMIAMYEYWIELKMWELEHDWAARTEHTVADFMREPGG
jgi:glycosyltransferase involved in cell wall biosynthesis